MFSAIESYAQTKMFVLDTNKVFEKCATYKLAKKMLENKLGRFEKETLEMEEQFSKKFGYE